MVSKGWGEMRSAEYGEIGGVQGGRGDGDREDGDTYVIYPN